MVDKYTSVPLISMVDKYTSVPLISNATFTHVIEESFTWYVQPENSEMKQQTDPLVYFDLSGCVCSGRREHR